MSPYIGISKINTLFKLLQPQSITLRIRLPMQPLALTAKSTYNAGFSLLSSFNPFGIVAVPVKRVGSNPEQIKRYVYIYTKRHSMRVADL